MSNVLDLLLSSDTSKLKRPTKTVPMKRLSKELGVKIDFTCKALDFDEMANVKESASSKDAGDYQLFMVIEGVKEPSLKNNELLKKFNAITPKELLKKW